MKSTFLLATLLILASANPIPATPNKREHARFAEARQNARLANEAFERCRRYVDG